MISLKGPNHYHPSSIGNVDPSESKSGGKEDGDRCTLYLDSKDGMVGKLSMTAHLKVRLFLYVNQLNMNALHYN